MIGKLYTADGPFVSAYVGARSAVENAQQRYETTWRNVERELAEQGADQATVEAVAAARGSHDEGDTRVVIASHGSVHIARSLPAELPADVVRVSPLPHVAPLVDAASHVRPHVVALIDRTGADVYAYTDSETEIAEFTVVRGDAADIRKVHGAGGWAMRRMQARAEEGWEQNAKEIADAIERVCRDVGATLIVVAGDAREIELVRNDLPTERQGMVEQVSGGRGADGSNDHVFEQVAEKVEERRTKDVIALLERYEENRGRGTLAADGLAAVIGALRSSQVDTLLLAEDYVGDEQVWFGPEPMHLAATKDELAAMGVEQPAQAAALDVLLRAALATNADVVRVPGGLEQTPRGGVGALLRFDLQS
jgi:hypothetical protein